MIPVLLLMVKALTHVQYGAAPNVCKGREKAKGASGGKRLVSAGFTPVPQDIPAPAGNARIGGRSQRVSVSIAFPLSSPSSGRPPSYGSP